MTLSLCRGLWYPSLGDTGQCCLQEQEEPPPVSSEPFRCSLKDPHRKVQPEDSHARTHTENLETEAAPDTTGREDPEEQHVPI